MHSEFPLQAEIVYALNSSCVRKSTVPAQAHVTHHTQ